MKACVEGYVLSHPFLSMCVAYVPLTLTLPRMDSLTFSLNFEDLANFGQKSLS